QGQVDSHRAGDQAVELAKVLATGQVDGGAVQVAVVREAAEQLDNSAGVTKAHGHGLRGVVHHTQGADDRRRQDRRAVRFVEQRDVAGDHRHAQRLAGRRHAADALLELEVDIKTLRVAEVEAVGDGDGP